MKLSIACDHGGFDLKEELIPYLKEEGYEVEDFGTYNKDSCDYPDFAVPAAKAVTEGRCDFGIVICSTGIGISIAANKVKGIRCALCDNLYCAEMTRRHNNANMVALGAHITTPQMAKKILDVFLKTEFEGGRHARRIGKVDDILA